MEYKSLVFDKNRRTQAQIETRNTQDLKLETGEVLIRAQYSGINYKDALGVLDQSAIFKTNPIVPGIDVSGIIVESKSRKFRPAQKVLVNGAGLGEDKDGGYSQYVKVHESCVVALPQGLSLKESMILGTAGFTAALAIDRMIQNGQSIEKGPILVSGATGGVGSFAVQILSQLGFMVEATSSRPQDFTDYLEGLGAHLVSDTAEILNPPSPLMKSRWGGLVDNLGGGFLESVLPQIGLWGNVASIGLAQGLSFKTTVMPFILRGVSLLGASSNNCPQEKRKELWQNLASTWKPKILEDLVTDEVSLEGLIPACEKLYAHKNHGRILVKLS